MWARNENCSVAKKYKIVCWSECKSDVSEKIKWRHKTAGHVEIQSQILADQHVEGRIHLADRAIGQCQQLWLDILVRLDQMNSVRMLERLLHDGASRTTVAGSRGHVHQGEPSTVQSPSWLKAAAETIE